MTVDTVLTGEAAADLRRREYRAFEDGAAQYNANMADVGRAARSKLLDLAELDDGLSLLDVCTGPGWLAIDGARRRTGVMRGPSHLRHAPDVNHRAIAGHVIAWRQFAIAGVVHRQCQKFVNVAGFAFIHSLGLRCLALPDAPVAAIGSHVNRGVANTGTARFVRCLPFDEVVAAAGLHQ